MATMILAAGSVNEKFPVATSVGQYLRTAKNPGGAPVGAVVAAVAVAADGTLTYTTVVRGVPYTAYALVAGQHRYIDFMLANSDASVKREGVAGIKVVEVTVDIGVLTTISAADVDVALPTGTAKIGDIVVGGFNVPALGAHLVIQELAIVATDSLRIRVTNPSSASSANPAAASATFAIISV